MVPVLIMLTAAAGVGCYCLAIWAERFEIKYSKKERRALYSYASRRKNAATELVREIPGVAAHTLGWIKTVWQFGVFALTLLLSVECLYAFVKYRQFIIPQVWPVIRLILGIVILIAIARYFRALWEDLRHPPEP